MRHRRNVVRSVIAATALLGLMFLGAGCNETNTRDYRPVIDIQFTQQPVGGLNIERATCGFVVTLVDPSPGSSYDASKYTPVTIQVNWYSMTAPYDTTSAANFRRSQSFQYSVSQGSGVTYTGVYEYPYTDPSGAEMEGEAVIYWEDRNLLKEQHSAKFKFRSGYW